VRRQSLSLLIAQTGASEIFVNGRLLRLGTVSADPVAVQAQTLPNSQLVALPPGNGPEQVIAVRFALQRNIPYIRVSGRPTSGDGGGPGRAMAIPGEKLPWPDFRERRKCYLAAKQLFAVLYDVPVPAGQPPPAALHSALRTHAPGDA
jgi:hypothetical protein